MSTDTSIPVRSLAAAVIAQAVLDLQRPDVSVRREARRFLRSVGVESWLAVMQVNGQCRRLREALATLSEEGFTEHQRCLLVDIVTPY